MRKMVAVMKRYPRRKIIILRKREYLAALASPTLPDFLRGATGQLAA